MAQLILYATNFATNAITLDTGVINTQFNVVVKGKTYAQPFDTLAGLQVLSDAELDHYIEVMRAEPRTSLVIEQAIKSHLQHVFALFDDGKQMLASIDAFTYE